MKYSKSLSYDRILDILDNVGYESAPSIDVEDSDGNEVTHSFVYRGVYEDGIPTYIFDVLFPFDDILPFEITAEVTSEETPYTFRVDFVRGFIGGEPDEIHKGEYGKIINDGGGKYAQTILDNVTKWLVRQHPGASILAIPHEERRAKIYERKFKQMGYAYEKNIKDDEIRFLLRSKGQNIIKKMNGGIIKKYFAGGRVTTSTGTDITGAGVDTQLINARPGDFVVNRAAVRGMGHNYFKKITKGIIPKAANGGMPGTTQVAVQPGEVVIPGHNAMKFGIGNLMAINSRYGGRNANKPSFDNNIRTAAAGGLIKGLLGVTKGVGRGIKYGTALGAGSLVGNLIHPQLGAAVAAKINKPSEPAFSKLLGHAFATGLGAITHPNIGGLLSTSIIANNKKATKEGGDGNRNEGGGSNGADVKIAKKIYAEIYKIRKNQEKFFKFVREEFKDAKEKESLTDKEGDGVIAGLQDQYSQILNALDQIGLSKAGEDEGQKPKKGIDWGKWLTRGAAGTAGAELARRLLRPVRFMNRTALGAGRLVGRGITGLQGLVGRGIAGIRGFAGTTARSLLSSVSNITKTSYGTIRSAAGRLAGPMSRVASGFRANLGSLGSKLSTARSIPRVAKPSVNIPKPIAKGTPNVARNVARRSLMMSAGKGALGMAGRILMPATGVGIGLQLALWPTSVAHADRLNDFVISAFDDIDYQTRKPKRWEFLEFLSRLSTFPDVRKRFPLDTDTKEYYDLVKLFPDVAHITSYEESHYGKSSLDTLVRIYGRDIYELLRKTFLKTINANTFDYGAIELYINILYKIGIAKTTNDLAPFMPNTPLARKMARESEYDARFYNKIQPILDILSYNIKVLRGIIKDNQADYKESLRILKHDDVYNRVFKVFAVNFENEKEFYLPKTKQEYENDLKFVMDGIKDARSGKFDYILSNDRSGMSLDRTGLRNGGVVQTAFVGGLIQLGTKVLPRVAPIAVRGLKSVGRRGLLNHKVQKMLLSDFKYKDDLSALSDPDFRRFLGEPDEIRQPTTKESIFLPYTDDKTGYVDYQQFSKDFLAREKRRKKITTQTTQTTTLPAINAPKWSRLPQPKPKRLAIPVPLPVQKPADIGLSAELLEALVNGMMTMNNRIDENQKMTAGTLARVLDKNRDRNTSVPFSMPAGTAPIHSYIENID